MSEVLWQPSTEAVATSQMTTFRTWLEETSGRTLADGEALHRFSVEDPGAFWDGFWRWAEVVGERGEGPAVVDLDRMPGARFFPEANLNFAENLLRRRDEGVAIVARDETGARRELSYAALHREVATLASALRAQGIGRGDRVAAFMPNIPETTILMLAASSVGATFSSCSPDFGVRGVLDRFGQIEPRLLFTADGYHYGGKNFDSLAKVREMLGELPTVEKVVVVPNLGETADLDGIEDALDYREFVDGHATSELSFERLPFDHPLYVLFSSGTTGKPKCIVHGQGGTLLQHLKEHRLHTDLRPDERLFYFTTCGWMMWNWLISGLAVGAAVVLFDGNPFHPDAHALFRLAEEERVSVFGTSAKYIDAVSKAGIHPGKDHDLSTVRALLSTGSPLSPEAFDFVYEHIGSELQLASISGGTDIVSCFVLGDPTLPVRRGEIQGPGLGMDVRVYSPEGERVRLEMGELVCATPFPSMPIYFWNDPEGERYRRAYFERFEGVWCHGDFCMESADGGYVITGRSDAVLNPGGVRIGTAEIYRPVGRLEEIAEAVVIGQPFDGDVRVILFVKMSEGAALDDALQKRIRGTIRANSSPRHVPAKILEVNDIPRTRSGKISELTVRNVVMGRPVENVEALANPESLREFEGRAELDA